MSSNISKRLSFTMWSIETFINEIFSIYLLHPYVFNIQCVFHTQHLPRVDSLVAARWTQLSRLLSPLCLSSQSKVE